MATNWSALHGKVLDVIASKLVKLSDNFSFTAVCSSWRSVGLEHRRDICHPFFPRLVVPGETEGSETRGCLEAVEGEHDGYLTFCYKKDGKNFTEQLQIPHGCYCCGSSSDWLVLIDDNFDMQLFNPLSGASFELPSSTTLPPPLPDFPEFCKYYVDKAIISADPTSAETTVLLIYSGAPQRLAFCKLGDRAWTPIKSLEGHRSYTDAIYSRGKFYAIRDPGYCDIVDIQNQTVVQYAVPPPREVLPENRYIVESNGQFFLVVRKVIYDRDSNVDSDCDCHGEGDDDEDVSAEENNDDSSEELDIRDDEDEDASVEENSDDTGDEIENNDHSNNCTACGDALQPFDWSKLPEILRRYRTARFRVSKLKEYPDGSRIWMKVENIGNNAFFIGYNNSFSIPATDNLGYKTCKPNSIYFTNDHKPLEHTLDPIRHDIGVFSLDSQATESIYPADTKIMRPPPFWLNLNAK